MSTVITTFPDGTYTSSNKPSVETLKTDIQALETGHNELETRVVAATASVSGTVELATDSEATTGTDTTRAVTPANILAVMKLLNPIGTIREFSVSTNPGTLLGFGTWSAYGTGRFTIAIDSGDTQFDTVDETGGAETVTLTTTELPAHTHTGTTASDGAHTHNVEGSSAGGSGGTRIDAQTSGVTDVTSSNGAHTHTFTTASAGTGSAFSIMNPYIVVYRWVRTA